MPRLLLVFVLVFASFVRAQWSVELTRDATAIVRFDGSRVLSFDYAAWGPNWKYADVETSLKFDRATPGGPFAVDGGIKSLGTTFTGRTTWQSDADAAWLTFDYAFDTSTASTGNTGGAVQFNARLSADIFDAKTIDPPALAGDGLGFVWSPVPGQFMRVRFENLARDVAFEKGRPDQLRAWVLPSNLPAGPRRVRMTIVLPAGSTFRGLPAARYADPDPQTWLTNTVDWSASPVDLSGLNDKPAGRRGFVRADGERLAFADGTEAKFWGCNVQAYAVFNATNAAIEQQAKRIAALGFNLVRIHHHDSADWVSPNVFVKDARTTQTLDAASLDRIDYWVKCLKDNGVYVWLDLHTGRPFRAGDGIPGFEELTPNKKTGNRQGRGFNYINPRITELMKDFAKAYLTRVNRYTGVAYTDEPAVMGVLITNENDITDHFGNVFLPDKKLPKHKAMYDRRRDEIVRERKLDGGLAWKNWLPGPGKVVLNQIQYEWGQDFVAYLRDIGVKVPLATTNFWGSDPLFSLPALTAGDVIDVHSYGLAESLSSNPRHDGNSAFWVNAGQVSGKPVTVTEWNTPAKQRDRFTQPLYVAATAAFQGWDAPMIFGYQQTPLKAPTAMAEWGISNDPALLPLMPAAALLYRRGDVSPAEETVTLALPAEKLLYEKISPDTSRALRTLGERHALRVAMPATPLLPWLAATPAAGKVIDDPGHDAIGRDATGVTSDTGQLKRDWADGVFTIDTPRTQAAVGWIGGRDVTLGDVTVRLDTAKAAVVVSALDDLPLATSRKMLLTVAAQADERKSAGGIVAEPVTGGVTFKSAIARAAALSPDGKLTTPIAVENGRVVLTGRDRTHWFVIER